MPIRAYNKYMWNSKQRKTRRKSFAKDYPTANYLLKEINGVRALLNTEVKHLDTNVTSATQGTTALVTPLTKMAQGVNGSQRNGQQVKFRTLRLRINIQRNALATSVADHVRVIVFRFHYPDGALPTANKILESPTDYLSYFDPNEARAYRVLFDRVVTLTSDSPDRILRINRTRLNSISKYDTTAADTAGLVSGHFFVLYLSDTNTNSPYVGFNSRMMYVDN